jgi:hypothetical protein
MRIPDDNPRSEDEPTYQPHPVKGLPRDHTSIAFKEVILCCALHHASRCCC